MSDFLVANPPEMETEGSLKALDKYAYQPRMSELVTHVSKHVSKTNMLPSRQRRALKDQLPRQEISWRALEEPQKKKQRTLLDMAGKPRTVVEEILDRNFYIGCITSLHTILHPGAHTFVNTGMSINAQRHAFRLFLLPLRCVQVYHCRYV